MTLSKPEHVFRDRHGITRVHCKCCGTVIKEMHPFAIEQRKAADGTIIQTHKTALTPTAVYRELTLVCKDDAGHQNFHVTHCCSNCLPIIVQDLDKLDEMYRADMDEFVIGEGMSTATVDTWRKLKVVGVK